MGQGVNEVVIKLYQLGYCESGSMLENSLNQGLRAVLRGIGHGELDGVGAVVIAFLLGGLAVSEYHCRNEKTRHSMRWVEDGPAPPRTFEGQHIYR